MSDSKLLRAAAPLTNLRASGRHLFGRLRGHPVSVTQQSALDGNRIVFHVLLAPEAVHTVAMALQDREGLKAAGLKHAMFRLVPEQRILEYSHLPAVRSPKPEDIKAMLDSLTRFADRGGPPLGERCEQCGAAAPRMRLLNGSPVQLCDADFQKRYHQYGAVSAAVEASKTDWAKALGFGLLGLLAGSLAWAFILVASGYIFSLAAIAIAILIGYLVTKGAGKPNYALIGVMAVLTIAAIFAGTILWLAMEIVLLDEPFDLGLAIDRFLAVVREDPGALGSSVFFGLLGVFAAGSYMVRGTRAATPRFEVVE